MGFGSPDIEVLSREQCIERLRAGGVGRVALTERSLPVILPVFYTLTGDAVVFRTQGRLLETAARDGHVVCFETDCGGLDPLSTWSVLVTGRLGPGDFSIELQEPPAWAVGSSSLTARLSMALVTGRSLRRSP